MTYKKVKNKLINLYADEIKKIIIKRNGSYILYDIYQVTNFNGKWQVNRYGQYIKMFDNSPAAISWCLADNTGQIALAHNLILADNRLQNKKNDILIAQEFIKQNIDSDMRSIVLTRITHDLYTCREIKIEIKNYCLSTKYIQIKGFITNAIK